MKLYSYFRSSAAYRVRIALGLKGLEYDYAAVNLLKREQKSAAYVARNPQGLVPALETEDGATLAQSIAIIEWLEELHPDPPLLPIDTTERARVRAVVANIACDIHPLCNIAVIDHLRENLGASESDVLTWFKTWMHRGFDAVETVLAANAQNYSFGEKPGMADVFLVPQVFNARRFGVSLENYPNITRVEEAANELAAFSSAAPEKQPDFNG
jgi:maleylacetoacetate isomerase